MFKSKSFEIEPGSYVCNMMQSCWVERHQRVGYLDVRNQRVSGFEWLRIHITHMTGIFHLQVTCNMEQPGALKHPWGAPLERYFEDLCT